MKAELSPGLHRRGFSFASRTYLSESDIIWLNVTGAEFERRLKRLARKMRKDCSFVGTEGKGSHGRIYLGAEFTTLKDRKKEIGEGLLRKMCSDLGIDRKDL